MKGQHTAKRARWLGYGRRQPGGRPGNLAYYRSRDRRRSRQFLTLGLVLVALSGSVLGWQWWYRHHAAATAQALVTKQELRDAQAVSLPSGRRIATSTASKPCVAPALSSPAAVGDVRMILMAPSIDLTAPVLAGDSSSQLAVGVGHLPTSSWPDQGGTTVLEAHDVTFFANIDRLHSGETIVLTAPCRQWRYVVTGGQVLRAGTPVSITPQPTLVLVTCWPTNALYFTNQRYVLRARLTSSVGTGAAASPVPILATAPTAVLPTGLSAGWADPSRLGVPEGTLTVTGNPSPDASASPQVLAAANSALTVFDVGLLAAENASPAWWQTEAPSSHGPMLSSAWPLRRNLPVWMSPVNVVLHADGSRIQSAALSSVVRCGSSDYKLSVSLGVSGARYVIASWSMSRT